jgi:single-stranded-DNA-specific exonuclease
VITKNWQIAELINKDVLGSWPEIDPVLLQLLWNRNIRTQEAIDEFLNPDWSQDVHDPYLFRDMKKAVERIYEAVGAKQKIGIFGDYDADGVSAAVMLATTLKKLGAIPEVYLPHREREGYGINNEAIKYLADKGVELLITCDCGIANVSQVAYANSLGLVLIITDHHQQQAELPPAYAILHCGLEDETYPFKYLSGGGVAFKLVQGLLRYEGCHLSKQEGEAWEKWLLDLVAISTVADMVRLVGENRTLALYGLKVLCKTRRLGLRKIIEVAGLRFDNLGTYSIGFQIAPRINAAGRMDHANAAYALLVSENATEAEELARALNLTNSERQKVTEEMLQTARLQIGELKPEQYFVHAFEPSWQLGIVGLVAGKLVQEYNRPALAMCQIGDKICGSGRSGVGNFDLAAALKECQEHLITWGGHKEAAGFSLGKDKLEEFLKAFTKIVKRELKGINLAPILNIDLPLKLNQVDWSLYEQVEKMEPIGQLNPTPKFVSYGLNVAGLIPVGSTGQHLRLVLEGDGLSRKFILFRQGDASTQFRIGDAVDVVYEVGVNEWNGNRELELKLVDIKLSKDKE